MYWPNWTKKFQIMSSGFGQKDTVFIYLQKTVFSYESEDMKKALEIRIEYFLFCYWEGCIMCVLHTSTHDTGIHFLNHDQYQISQGRWLIIFAKRPTTLSLCPVVCKYIKGWWGYCSSKRQQNIRSKEGGVLKAHRKEEKNCNV